MKYATLLTSNPAWRLLASDADASALSHAYLLLSSDQRTSDSLLRLFSAKIVCGCLECNTCRRAIEGKLPDIKYFDADKVLSEDIEAIVRNLNVTPLETEYKIFVIANAHTMPIAAQNKLLKSLEEPPPFVIFLLAAPNRATVLSTIASRCRVVEIPPFAERKLFVAMQPFYQDEQRLRLAVAAADGQISVAEQIMSDTRYSKLFDLAVDTLVNLVSSKDVARLSAPIIAARGQLEQFVKFCDILLRDALVYQAGSTQLVRSADIMEQIATIATMYPTVAILNIRKRLVPTRARIVASGIAASIVDEILFVMLEERFKCRPL